MTRQPGYNCKNGSAWHTWQIAGAEWQKDNPEGDPHQAACEYAAIESSDVVRSAKYRAFLECAR